MRICQGLVFAQAHNEALCGPSGACASSAQRLAKRQGLQSQAWLAAIEMRLRRVSCAAQFCGHAEECKRVEALIPPKCHSGQHGCSQLHVYH